MKAVVGVLPLWDDEKESIWMLPAYMNAINRCGALAIILPLVASREDIMQLCEMCDGFLFTGGHDVDPSLYSQPTNRNCGKSCPERDFLESEVFAYALAKDKPVLGICRGIQIFNALCGGDLYQDLPSEHEGVSHSMIAPYNREWHKVNIIEGSPLSEIISQKTMGVNSYHHQAIKNLAPTLQAMAVSSDGLIEAVFMPNKRFVWAVQWHPEFDFHSNDNSLKIVGHFISQLECK